MSGPHSTAVLERINGEWWMAECACGWSDGPFAGAELAVAAYGDHRQPGRRGWLKRIRLFLSLSKSERAERVRAAIDRIAKAEARRRADKAARQLAAAAKRRKKGTT